MATEVRWDEFDKLHVVRKLKELVGKWWNVQLNFTDDKGFLRGVPEGRFFSPISKACQFITSDNKGFAGCVNTARTTTVGSRGMTKSKVSKCHAGFSTLSVPILVDKQYLGCVFGDGFILEETAGEQRILIRSYFEKNFPEKKHDIDDFVGSLPVLSTRDVDYLTQLIYLVIEEIVLVYKNLDTHKEKLAEMSAELGERYNFAQMVGKSAPMQHLYRMIERVCKSDATVLIQGENGTGKELIARALHYNSPRGSGKFLVTNCGAFNENLLESELFGHVKGSFTGAIANKKGLFEDAENGTLFLDEVGEMTMTMQVKLLRVLQDGSFTPVGSTQNKTANARILAATNRDLAKMVKEGTFREDLFYRLNVISLTVPPLRNRPEDIPMLIEHFLKTYAKHANQEKKTVSKDCLRFIMNFTWPGNVRQLENEIERLCVLAGSDAEISAEFLSPAVSQNRGVTAGPSGEGQSRLTSGINLKDAVEELEKSLIFEGLKRNRWNKSKLAKELGISRAGLIMKVEKYGLDKRG